ncbi:MAG: hypothetical protein CL857_00975 [Cryomorphaceae bacterium]|nr:hypothetical protein [Cryomorphaceae bacterium]
MKSHKKQILTLFISMTCGLLSSQSILDDFAIDLNQGKVLLAWTIKSGNVCNGIQIYRSSNEDSINFELIEDIQGVCGDLISAVAYTYTDETPTPNKVNYYKLLLGQEFSDVLGIEVLFIPSRSYMLKPHPVRNSSALYFNNSNNHNFELKIFDDFGSIVYLHETNSNRFILDSTMVASGLYYFTLENKSEKSIINGKALFVD